MILALVPQGSGWWQHEVCYGKYVKQVHEVRATLLFISPLIECTPVFALGIHCALNRVPSTLMCSTSLYEV